MLVTTEKTFHQEIATLLTRIQDACRAYPTESERQRKMTFATIRTAAETTAAVCTDALPEALADDVQRQVNHITAALDDLSDRFGSDDVQQCGACGTPLAKAQLGGGRLMAYCTNCPTDILDAVREISDITEVDIL